MAEEVYIPKLGQTVEEVTLIRWLVADGEQVEQSQEVLEVETDKAVFNVEAAHKGYIHLGPFEEGDVVPVLTVVAVIGAKEETFKVQAAPPAAGEKPEPSKPARPASSQQAKPTPGRVDQEKVFVSPRARKLAEEKGINPERATPTGGGGVRVREQDVRDFLSQAPRVSPLARRLAREAGLDLQTVAPSGPRGEITRADVEFALARRAAQPMDKQEEISPARLADLAISKRVPLKGVRGVIAERMGRSAQTTARVTLFMDADATALVEWRQRLKEQVEGEWGFAPGYNEILARVCAIALTQFPYMNARKNGDVIEELAEINIGIAVDADQGLYVPVIRDADKKSLRELGTEFRQRVDEIRKGRISPGPLSGGTFTLTNLGMYEVEGFTPVINLPEAAILGMGKITAKAVIVDGEVAVRQMMALSLAFDHRLVDGAPAARFLQALKTMIESPDGDQLSG